MKPIPSLRSSGRRRIGAWLSLLAMLLVFAGPLIGQGLSLAHGAGPANDDICGAVPGPSLAAQQGAGSADHHGTMLWEKCGYCSLLFQHPALSDSHALAPRLALVPVSFAHNHFIPEQASAPVFPGARSRAPPQASV
ncbi:DUF2946 domain-containing protein [Pseudomonas gingeri]|uniref:DUF2946 domain-containing protein n=1 Tax=Pseudomonas gingeri TaxID=117681 RepID=UPI0015A002EB|nr:DUF2946 domain-containing protein [Pseudomonas gingeri]NWD71835.1 DUF2946 domain-containing protein [Pseudomonas gingeri]